MNKNLSRTEFTDRISRLTPELQIILWAIRQDDLLTEKAEQILRSRNDLNSSRLIELSFKTQLFPLLFKKINDLGREKIDAGLYQSLKTKYHQNIARNIKLSSDLEKIVSRFQKNNLSIISYKGPVSGILADNEIAFGYSADLDIMIKNQEFNQVFDLLSEIGFRPLFPSAGKVLGYIRRSWRDMTMRRKHLQLDIHQQVAKGPSFFRPDETTWESTIDLKLDKEYIQTFSLEDTLVFQAINTAKDGFSSLKRLRNISGLVINHPELDWEKCLGIARRRKSYKILLTALKMAQLFCGSSLPADISALGDTGQIQKSFHYYTDRLFTSNFSLDIFTWYLTVPRALDSLFSKIRFFFWFGTRPSPQIHRGMFKLPGVLFFLFPVFHPFYLFFKYGTRFFFKTRRAC